MATTSPKQYHWQSDDAQTRIALNRAYNEFGLTSTEREAFAAENPIPVSTLAALKTFMRGWKAERDQRQPDVIILDDGNTPIPVIIREKEPINPNPNRDRVKVIKKPSWFAGCFTQTTLIIIGIFACCGLTMFALSQRSVPPYATSSGNGGYEVNQSAEEGQTCAFYGLKSGDTFVTTGKSDYLYQQPGSNATVNDTAIVPNYDILTYKGEVACANDDNTVMLRVTVPVQGNQVKRGWVVIQQPDGLELQFRRLDGNLPPPATTEDVVSNGSCTPHMELGDFYDANNDGDPAWTGLWFKSNGREGKLWIRENPGLKSPIISHIVVGGMGQLKQPYQYKCADGMAYWSVLIYNDSQQVVADGWMADGDSRPFITGLR